MSKIHIGDLVYRRTINDHVLAPWKVIAERGNRFHREYYLQSPDDRPSLLVIEAERNLFKVPESEEI